MFLNGYISAKTISSVLPFGPQTLKYLLPGCLSKVVDLTLDLFTSIDYRPPTVSTTNQ